MRGREIHFMIAIKLNKGEDKRVIAGHPWIFSNEVRSSLKGFEPGDLVRVEASNGRPLGVGFVNPHTLIAVRMLTTGPGELDPDFVGQRLTRALELRSRLYPASTTYRAVYGESDGLPGLIVDRYDAAVAVQILTAGMERKRDEVLAAILSNLDPHVVVLRNDSPYRKLEGLPIRKEIAHGRWTEPVSVHFSGIKLRVDLMEGQKTGLFLDQRDNLDLLAPFSANARVLDGFCYTGAWGLKAALTGASSVTAVDSSAQALGTAEINARENACENRWRGICGNALHVLDSLRDEPPFDIVILDPPAFARRKDHLASAKNRYRSINMGAISLLAPGGILFSCSCSHHLDSYSFKQVLSEAVARSGRHAVLLATGGQAKDHPALLSARETEYLKCFVLKVW
jgi:23S rRNA (cytosine1962-C5)-methyltransferase